MVARVWALKLVELLRPDASPAAVLRHGEAVIAEAVADELGWLAGYLQARAGATPCDALPVAGLAMSWTWDDFLRSGHG